MDEEAHTGDDQHHQDRQGVGQQAHLHVEDADGNPVPQRHDHRPVVGGEGQQIQGREEPDEESQGNHAWADETHKPAPQATAKQCVEQHTS